MDTSRIARIGLCLLATASTASDCQTAARSGYDCHVDTRGLRNENGLIVDVVHNWCAGKPRAQTLVVWIEARTGPGHPWERAGTRRYNFIPPDAEGTRTRVEGGRCQPDVEYATAWQASGIAADGTPFRIAPDSDWFGTSSLC